MSAGREEGILQLIGWPAHAPATGGNRDFQTKH
jgi:hypothetical protein